MNLITRFLSDESGQDMVEYGLLAAFISIVAITALTAVGDQLKIVFNLIKDKLAAA